MHPRALSVSLLIEFIRLSCHEKGDLFSMCCNRTLASSAFFMLILRWILASPRSICAIIFSISVISSFRSQKTAEYARTSSGVLPSTSWQMLSKSSRPYFSQALINWLNSRLDQFVKPWIKTKRRNCKTRSKEWELFSAFWLKAKILVMGRVQFFPRLATPTCFPHSIWHQLLVSSAWCC